MSCDTMAGFRVNRGFSARFCTLISHGCHHTSTRRFIEIVYQVALWISHNACTLLITVRDSPMTLSEQATV